MISFLKQINDILGVLLTSTIILLGIIENSSKIAKKPISAIVKWFAKDKDKKVTLYFQDYSLISIHCTANRSTAKLH